MICVAFFFLCWPFFFQALLEEGRRVGGTHFVVIHSDEILTTSLASDGSWFKVFLFFFEKKYFSQNFVMMRFSLDEFLATPGLRY